jgi:NADPH:quinone reductase-like Zn-dependent oxidoreductase
MERKSTISPYRSRLNDCSSRTVTTTTSTKEKIDWLLALPNGPTHAANYKTEDFAAVVKQVTDNKGANVVIDFVGQSHFKKNIDCMALDGRMTIVSFLSGMFIAQVLTLANSYLGSIVDSVNLAPILFKRLHIEGSTLRSQSLEYQADLIEGYMLELLITLNFTPYLVIFPGLDWMSCQRSQEKAVRDPFGRIFTRQAT